MFLKDSGSEMGLVPCRHEIRTITSIFATVISLDGTRRMDGYVFYGADPANAQYLAAMRGRRQRTR